MISAPHSPLDWTQEVETGPIYDAAGKVVSLVENRAYLAGVVMLHPLVVKKLKEITDAYELTAGLLGVPAGDVLAMVIPARELLRRCEVEPASDDTKVAS